MSNAAIIAGFCLIVTGVGVNDLSPFTAASIIGTSLLWSIDKLPEIRLELAQTNDKNAGKSPKWRHFKPG